MELHESLRQERVAHTWLPEADVQRRPLASADGLLNARCLQNEQPGLPTPAGVRAPGMRAGRIPCADVSRLEDKPLTAAARPHRAGNDHPDDVLARRIHG